MPMNPANLDRAPMVFGLPFPMTCRRPSRVMRAVLLALRDWMTAAEVVEFARQLPEGWVPVVFEEWRPQSAPPPKPSRIEFAASVAAHLGGNEAAFNEVDIADALQNLVPMLPDRLFVRKSTCCRTTRTGSFH
ncbi:DUF2267 domain-containing protein [Roseovarius bejariae]|nr:DUF2267 domain-containing protein [Roseovarius bejariae]